MDRVNGSRQKKFVAGVKICSAVLERTKRLKKDSLELTPLGKTRNLLRGLQGDNTKKLRQFEKVRDVLKRNTKKIK